MKSIFFIQHIKHFTLCFDPPTQDVAKLLVISQLIKILHVLAVHLVHTC